MSRPILDKLDYTTRDYEGFRTLMIQKLQELMPEYTDIRQSDAGIVLIELNAMCLDILSYYLDSIANECFLVTATQRSSIMKFCKMLGYYPRLATSAKYIQRFYRSDLTRPITIKAGTVVKTESATQNGAKYFTTLSDLTIEGDNEFGDVTVIHGVPVYAEKHQMSSSKNMSFALNYSPALIDNTFELMVQRPNEQVSETWKRVDTFSGAKSTDKVYMVEVNDKNETKIIFGDNVFGAIPENCKVLVNYFVGGGSAGNVGNNTIKVMYRDNTGVSQTFNVSQLVVGQDRETLDEIKMNAPIAHRNIWGALTCDDYAGVVKTYFADVADAQAIRADDDWTHLAVDDIVIYFLSQEEIDFESELSADGHFTDIPNDFYEENVTYTTLLSNMTGFFDSNTSYVDIGSNESPLDSARKLVGTRNIYFRKPRYAKLNLKCNLIVRDYYSFNEVSEKVKSYLFNYFRLGNLNFNEDISLQSVMYRIIDNSEIEGIRYLNIRLEGTQEDLYDFVNNDLIMPHTGVIPVLSTVEFTQNEPEGD